MSHPRERRPFDSELSRRDFLKKSAGAAAAVSGVGAILAACGKGTPAPIGSQGGGGPSSTALPLARPNRPVKWPIYPDNKPIASGLSDKEVASRLSISPDTVRTHLEHVFDKLGASDRTAAVAEALPRHLIE